MRRSQKKSRKLREVQSSVEILYNNKKQKVRRFRICDYESPFKPVSTHSVYLILGPSDVQVSMVYIVQYSMEYSNYFILSQNQKVLLQAGTLYQNRNLSEEDEVLRTYCMYHSIPGFHELRCVNGIIVYPIHLLSRICMVKPLMAIETLVSPP